MSGFTPVFIETTHPLRKGIGSKVTVNGHDYNFTPNEHGAYVAEVPYERDVDSILSISAGYRRYDWPDREPSPPVARRKEVTQRNPKALPKDAVVPKKAKVDPKKKTIPRPGVAAKYQAPPPTPESITAG